MKPPFAHPQCGINSIYRNQYNTLSYINVDRIYINQNHHHNSKEKHVSLLAVFQFVSVHISCPPKNKENMKLGVDIQSYFKPLIYLLNIFGVPLVRHRDRKSTMNYRLLRSWGLLFFVIHIGGTIYYVIHFLQLHRVVAQYFNVTSTMFWVSLIIEFSLALFKIGSHLQLLLLAGSSIQKNLSDAIRRLWFSELKVRPLSIFIVTILLLVSILFDNLLFL